MAATQRRARFGLFDFDLDTGELLRSGAPVRLAAQPAQVLRVLIEANGALVTRETLRDSVWGSDVHVDFDRGLNQCISQIRGVLGDSVDSPRYVLTVPKRGYQFIAPLVSRDEEPPVRNSPPPTRRNAVAAAGGLAAVTVGIWAWRRGEGLKNLAVVRFDNETGDAAFDRFADNVTDTLIAQLTTETQGRVGVIGNAGILRRPRAERDLRQISSALQAKYIILGQVQKRAGATTVAAHLIRMPEQTHLKVVRMTIGDPAANGEDIARQLAGFVV